MATAPTRDRILDAAEELFAEQGFASSLRNITSSAGVNLAAVNYHFGSKEMLIQAVFARRLLPINRERIERLDELESVADAGPTAAQIVEAFIGPPLRMGRDATRGGPVFCRLLGHAMSQPRDQIRALLAEQFREVMQRFVEAVKRIRADLPELPDRKQARFERDFGLSAYDAGVLVAERENADYFERTAAGRDPKQAANWVMGDLFGVHVQAYPKYGSSKKGLPTTYYLTVAPSKIFRTSSNSLICRPGCIIKAAPFANRWISPSTSATSTWYTHTCATPTSPSWGRSPHPNVPKIHWRWRALSSVKNSCAITWLSRATSTSIHRWSTTTL